MGDVIDISIGLRAEMPFWPDSMGYQRIQSKSLLNGDASNVSIISSDIHAGTHIDAPSHFFTGGKNIDQLALEPFLGPAFVTDLSGVTKVSAADLASSIMPPECKRLLLRTDNSMLWKSGVKSFREDYVGLSDDAAQWIVDQQIELVGIDYLSVQCFNKNSRTHQILLGAEVIILEGLNLSAATPGIYELICLPLKLDGAEGAPARAVLRKMS